MAEAVEINRDIDGIAADQLAIDRRQIAVDAVIADRGDPDGHRRGS